MWKFILSILLAAGCSAQVFSPELIGSFGQASTPAFNPSNVTGMLLWLQADTFSNSPNGTAIQLWPDISGNGNHFTNETAARSPYITNGVLNGHSAVRFPATTIDFRWLSNALGFATALSNAEIFTILRSVVTPSVATVDTPWSIKRAGNGESAHPNTVSQIQEQFGLNLGINYTANVTNDYNDSFVITNFHIWNAEVNTNLFLARYNGNPLIGLDTIASSVIGFSNLMWLSRSADNSRSWNGEISEVMMFDRILSDANRSNIYAYFSNRYSIVSSNPAATVTPSNYLSGVVGWWRSDKVVTNDGSQIMYWPDISGNNRHLTNSTGQATYRANFFGSLPGIEFNGTTNNWKLFPPADINLTNLLTMIVVHKMRGDTRVVWSKQSGNYQYRYREGAANKMLFFLGGPSQTSSTGPQPIGNTRVDIIQRDPANNIRFWQNMTNSTPGAVVTVARIEVMGGQVGDNTISYDGYIAEALIMTNQMKAPDIIKLYTTYFKPRYPELP